MILKKGSGYLIKVVSKEVHLDEHCRKNMQYKRYQTVFTSENSFMQPSQTVSILISEFSCNKPIPLLELLHVYNIVGLGIRLHLFNSLPKNPLSLLYALSDYVQLKPMLRSAVVIGKIRPL